MGALSDYMQKRWGVRTRSVKNPLTGTVIAGITQVLRNNPDRFMVLIINLDDEVNYLAQDSAPSSSNGIRLDANGGSAVLTADEDGELVGYDWWIQSTGGGAIYVLETEAA